MTFETWRIPHSVLVETEAALQSAEHEVFVIWVGPRAKEPRTCQLTRLIVPEQIPESSPLGESVRIEGRELARIQFDNAERGDKSYVQIHTHPRDNVEMSPLDHEREVVNHVGGLSIIVPHYCAQGLTGFSGVNVYEREERRWRQWSRQEVLARIIVL
jgi:hypothetical protein